MRMLRRWLLLCALLCRTAHADVAADDPDTEIAKHYYEQGEGAYEHKDYAAALGRFQAAQRIRPSPAMDYNIARCYERLDQPALAIEAYERFLSTPQGHGNADVQARVAVLRARVAERQPAPRPRSRRYLAPGLTLGAALALAVTGTALWTAVTPAYADLDKQLQTDGSTSAVRSRARSLHAQENAGYVMWGLAAAAAVTDAILWAVAIRRARSGARAGEAPAVAPGGVMWTF
jgi:tetratricopeptide (TPR) repeat protein